ncbi:hypothetical protein COCSADRAFT_303842 [Bipolaris sorokiniana ND90Pr]|uniref:Uncharacterized protein n=1 Tax=Cochliobolus sativus (strain ND90Pr / ATCC 201652) TaxID=665912 RepID=M2T8J1_COCSN|nr:uncharacterized protein COCSADRAFT_303842 [Bipolaris sorokiniana ND90Pr]EMD65287.1 hypothetical protein COCSADRAFT_303842 [Bipolaris sorokiniana ND90Pr]
MPFPAAFGLPALPAHPPPVLWVLSSALPAPFIIKPSPCSCSCSYSSPHPIPSHPIPSSTLPLPSHDQTPIARLNPASPSTSPAAATGRHSILGRHLISSSSPVCPPTSLSRLCCSTLEKFPLRESALPFDFFWFGLSAALLASAPVSGRPFFPGHYLAVPDARCTCCCTSLWPTSGTRRLASCLCATVCRQCTAPPVPLHNICLSAAVCFVT